MSRLAEIIAAFRNRKAYAMTDQPELPDESEPDEPDDDEEEQTRS